jgi:uncharacterized protein YndB with AHSA1/START domain
MPTETGNFQGKTHPKDIKLVRVFDAPRAKVFECFTKAEHLAHFWPPKPFTMPVCQVDLKPGGLWHYTMRAPDGWEHACDTVYQQIEPPKKLVMKAALPGPDGRPLFELLQTIELEEKGGKTQVTLIGKILSAAPGSEPFLSGMEQGTNMTLDNLEEYLKEGKI